MNSFWCYKGYLVRSSEHLYFSLTALDLLLVFFHFKNESTDLLKLQAAMEGTSPGSPPTGGFRKTGNSEQYAFKKVNIEKYVKVIYMYQTCCQLVAQHP